MQTSPRARRIDATLFAEMREAFLRRPTIRHVAVTTGVEWRTAKRAVEVGWPRLGFRPLREILHDHQSEVRCELRDREVARTERDERGAMAKRMSDEVEAARAAMRTAAVAAVLVERLGEQLNQALEIGAVDLPAKVSPRLVATLARAANACAAAVERAMRIERMFAGETTVERDVLVVAEVVASVSDHDLDKVIEGGRVWPRVAEAERP